MNNFLVTDTKFYNELRNGVLFDLNLLDFTDSLLGNVEETVQVLKTISVETSVLASDFGSIQYTGGAVGSFLINGNWFNEGISVGSTIDIIWDGNLETETVISVTGINSSIITTTNANLNSAGLFNQSRSDFEFRVSSPPDRASFKYGLNQLNASSNNYSSPLGGNEQAYYTNSISGAFSSLIRIGSPNSWNLGLVEIKFDGTTASYVHTFTIKHTFKIPYYQDGQIGNVTDLVAPNNLSGTNSFKYGFGLFMSETNNSYNRIFEDVGSAGGVGYLNENFNGQQNDYAIENVVYTNTFDNSSISSAESNIVTCQIKNNSGNFLAGQKVILKHSKLPIESDYINNSQSFDNVFIFDSLETTEGAVSVDSTVITLCTVVLNADPTLLDVTFTIEYTASQQLLISTGDSFLLSVVLGDETLTPYLSNRVTLKIDSQVWAKNTDVLGLVQNNDIRFFEGDEDIVIPSSSEATDFKGYDADFVGLNCSFQTNAQEGAVLGRSRFKLIADNGTNSFELRSVVVFNSQIQQTNPANTTYAYQIVNNDSQNQYNIQPTESFNRIKIDSVVPASGFVWQDWNIQLAFKVSWRDWIANAGVDNIFYDATELNNNQNYKTSNYSDLNSYKIYGVMELNILSPSGVSTIYELYSNESRQLDFDVSGLNPMTADVFIYDINNDLVDNVYNNENVRIEIEFNHSLGLLNKIQGEIILEPENTTSQEWRLSTQKDWTNDLKPFTTYYIKYS